MSFKFCSNCGAQLPTLAPHASAGVTNNAFAPQHCANCGVTHYHNSKPCAGALIVKDGKVLLTKRGIEPFKGYWDLPGGYLEAGEHPLDGMVREMHEELGVEVRAQELLGVYMDRYGDEQDAAVTLNFYYIAELVAGEPRAADDVSEFGWFAMNELPDAKRMAFEHEKQVLEDLREKLGRG